MAASFKLPSVTKKRRRAFESVPELSWSSVKIKEELKSGTFFKFGEVQCHVCIKNLKITDSCKTLEIGLDQLLCINVFLI